MDAGTPPQTPTPEDCSENSLVGPNSKWVKLTPVTKKSGDVTNDKSPVTKKSGKGKNKQKNHNSGAINCSGIQFAPQVDHMIGGTVSNLNAMPPKSVALNRNSSSPSKFVQVLKK